jgi:hypothetical protein
MTSDRYEQIGKITSTYLGIEDHGIMTCYLNMDLGSSVQGVGGYGLDSPQRDENDEFIGRVGTAYGCEFIRRILKACGVDTWEKLPGRTVFVIRESDRWGSKVLGIKPLPTERGEEFLFASLDEMVEAGA